MQTETNTKKVRFNFQFDPDEPAILMIETYKLETNIRSTADAIRVLLKKGFDQYQKEQAYLMTIV